VSLATVSTGGGGGATLLVSTVVLSDPETLFVELHADAANIIEPAKARLKIVLFMIFVV